MARRCTGGRVKFRALPRRRRPALPRCRRSARSTDHDVRPLQAKIRPGGRSRPWARAARGRPRALAREARRRARAMSSPAASSTRRPWRSSKPRSSPRTSASPRRSTCSTTSRARWKRAGGDGDPKALLKAALRRSARAAREAAGDRDRRGRSSSCWPGVNGAGKTTSIGKLAQHFQAAGVLGAARRRRHVSRRGPRAARPSGASATGSP